MDITVKCCYCNKDFIAHSTKAKWCSRKCKDIVFRLTHGVRVNPKVEPYHKECVICGKSFDTFRDATITCSPECAAQRHKQMKTKSRSYEHTAEEWKQIRKIQAKQRAEIRAIEKTWYKALHTVERECEECGALFYCLDSENRVTCSAECSKLYKNHKADRRVPDNQRIDKIALKKLYKRDKGICYLCGEKCDWNDWRISKKGNLYPGDKYPTKEHVIPICKGGLDAWDNVRLAHWKCNLEKADGIIKMQPMSHEFAYSQKFCATLAKKTAQYTLDGKLIKIWDSTGQIERETGLKSKHIQNVCRGDNSKTGNAYGFHWEYVS